ncbi:MAG: tyrosine-protein phosphatase [Solirubrobacterales bacterium]
MLVASALAACAVYAGSSLITSHADAVPTSDLEPAFTAQDHQITDISGLSNARELGSYTGWHGETVNYPRVIRTDELNKLTEADAQTLAEKYDVKLVIDLRTEAQIAEKPSVKIPGAKEVTVSLFGEDGDYSDDTVMYEDLVDKEYESAENPGPAVSGYAEVLKLLAETPKGTVLIHCSHGMDRTGTVMDLLYTILGVSRDDILHDYLLSNTSLGVTWATPQLLWGTFEGDISMKYGSMENYIENVVGVSPGEMRTLRAEYLVPQRSKGGPSPWQGGRGGHGGH